MKHSSEPLPQDGIRVTLKVHTGFQGLGFGVWPPNASSPGVIGGGEWEGRAALYHTLECDNSGKAAPLAALCLLHQMLT